MKKSTVVLVSACVMTAAVLAVQSETLIAQATRPAMAEHGGATTRSAGVPQFFTDSKGVAIKGYDVVSYFSGKAEAGSAQFSAEHGGATFHFVSAEHRDAFAADPVKYAPQYGGWCAQGMAGGYKAATDPKAFTVVGGKLYLNYSAKVSEGWSAKRDANIAKADANWPKVKDQVK